MRIDILLIPFLVSELLLEVVRVKNYSSSEQCCEICLSRGKICLEEGLIFRNLESDQGTGRSNQAALFLNKGLLVCLSIVVVVDDSSHLVPYLGLVYIEHIVVDKGHLCHFLGRVGCLVFVVEPKIVLINLAVI